MSSGQTTHPPAETTATSTPVDIAGVIDLTAVRDRSNSQTWSISQLAEEFNVSHRTLRYYETLGLLSPQRHGTTRVYQSRDRVRLALVLRGKRLGFGLEEVATIVNMYDETSGEAGQLTYLLSQIDSRRMDLTQRLTDIQSALHELDALQHECVTQLNALNAKPVELH